MADVVSPDCRLCDPGLVDYIIEPELLLRNLVY